MSENVNFEFAGADSEGALMHALTEEDDDALLQSYICPITREILVEPITLQVRLSLENSVTVTVMVALPIQVLYVLVLFLLSI